MSSVVTTIRFDSAERDWINSFAEVNGKSFSAQVRDWVLERLEDEMDALDLKRAIAKSDPNDKGITMDEFYEKYGE